MSDLKINVDTQRQEFIVTCLKCGQDGHVDLQTGLAGPIYCPCGEKVELGEEVEVSRMRDQ